MKWHIQMFEERRMISKTFGGNECSEELNEWADFLFFNEEAFGFK